MGTVARGTRGLSIRGAAHTCVSGAVDAILITQGSLALTSSQRAQPGGNQLPFPRTCMGTEPEILEIPTGPGVYFAWYRQVVDAVDARS